MAGKEIKEVALVGGGVIGSGWAIRCLANGLSVVITDPSPGAPAQLEQTIENAWSILEDTGLAEDGDRTKLRFAESVEEAVEGAEFVQENVPEREDLKIDVHAYIRLFVPYEIRNRTFY